MQEKRRFDVVTALPGLTVALEEISQRMRQLASDRCLCVISLAVVPDAALLRLSPEATQALRILLSRQIGAALRGHDRLYALESWEWLAVLDALSDRAFLTLALKRLADTFVAPVSLNGEDFAVTLVCAGACYPEHGGEARHLVQSARIARLYAERSASRYAIYEPDMERAGQWLQSLHGELLQALTGSLPGLALHLQPQVDLASGRCIAAEALLRWRRHNGSWVSPAQVLAVVERYDLRGQFTRWLLQQAMQTLAHLRREGVDIVLSINLSASDLLDPDLPALVELSLATWRIPAAALEIELTETAMIEDSAQVAEVLRALAALGCKLSVDDFGTGYATISYLQRLPVQEVKIDQSFVRHLADSARDRAIIASVIQLAHQLGIGVVAEGVESEAIAQILLELGCDRAQGFRYTPPLAPEDFLLWWRGRQARHAP